MASTKKTAVIVPQEDIHSQQTCTRSELDFFKCVDSVLKMDVVTLRRFIKEELEKMQKCSRCEARVINMKCCFFCPSYHLVCQNCTYGKCPKCESFVQWDCRSKWHDITVECEWNCYATINIFGYMMHLQLCKLRKYKCPGTNCQYICYLQDFQQHWHLNPLKNNRCLALQCRDEAFYWLLPDRNEVVYVTVEMSSNYEAQITVYEIDVVFPTSYTIETDNCQVQQKWTLLQNGTGRFQKIRKLQYYSSVLTKLTYIPN